MIEDYWQVATKDGKNIHGILDVASLTERTNQKSKKCILIIHGLTGHPHEYVHEVAAQYFTARGYDVFRPYLYGGENGRALIDCTLQTHAQDLKTILNTITEMYEDIFLIGHSYGGPTIMIAQPENITAVSLWDPTYNLPAVWEKTDVKELLGFYAVRFGGVDHLLSTEMVQEGMTKYNEEECRALSKTFSAPIQVITAEEGAEAELYATCKESWHSFAPTKKDCTTITGADHMFTKQDTAQRLFEKTKNWFAKFPLDREGV